MKNIKAVFFDEAKDIFSRKAEDDDSTQAHYLDKVLEMGRERGIQIVALTQYASSMDIAHSLIENSAIKILFGALGNAATYHESGKTLGATDEEIEYMMRHKAPGFGYVSDYRFGHPFRITFPDISILKNIPIPEGLIQSRTEEFLSRVKIVPPVHPAWRPGMPYDWKPAPKTDTKNKQKVSQTTQKEETQKPEIVISDDALAFLRYSAERIQKCLGPDGNPRLLLGQKPVFEAISISSGRRQNLVVKEVCEANLAVQHWLRVGKINSTVMEMKDRCWSLLEMEAPYLEGKGGWLHRYLARLGKDHYEQLGYVAEIEGRLQDKQNGFKQLDILCRHRATGEVFGVEIALASPEQEVINARQNLIGATPADKMVICCTTSKMLKRVEMKIRECADLQNVMGKIAFKLVGEFFA